MSAEGLTRRSLLAATAGAMAGGLMRPGHALAELTGPPAPLLRQQRVGRLKASATETVELSHNADLVGVGWQAPAAVRLELRFLDGEGRWSRWISAAGHGHGPDGIELSSGHLGDPLWTGGATVLQLRSRGEVFGLSLHLVDVSGGRGARREGRKLGPLARAAALPVATPVLEAGPGQPPIIARQGWAQGISPPKVAPEYGDVRLAFVHHTENPNGYSPGEVPAMLRAIYVFHRYVNGWNDIGYNFVIDLYGRIFEARAGGIEEPVVGAHAGGYNLVSTGVAVLGSFMSVPISAPARSALERLLAWKLSLHGLPGQGRVTVKVNPAGAIYSRFPPNAHVSLPRIAGHRDGDSTDCPGNVLYGELSSIRSAVTQLAPRPVRATLELSDLSSEPAVPFPTLTGALTFLDGTPIEGAKILLQARTVARKGEVVSEQTLAEALTNPQGQWSLPTALPNIASGPAHLRALCTGTSGYGAAVSAPLRASLSAVEVPAPTPPAAGPPAP